MTRVLASILALTLLVSLGAMGCATQHIQGTSIPATEENKAIYAMVMQYRRAVEERDANALQAMVSRRYYENASSTDDDGDDYGYDSLATSVLPQLRENIQAVRYRILMRDIEVDGDRAWADYEFFYNFKFVEGGKEAWKQKNDFNRLEFIKEDGGWKILAGL